MMNPQGSMHPEKMTIFSFRKSNHLILDLDRYIEYREKITQK